AENLVRVCGLWLQQLRGHRLRRRAHCRRHAFSAMARARPRPAAFAPLVPFRTDARRRAHPPRGLHGDGARPYPPDPDYVDESADLGTVADRFRGIALSLAASADGAVRGPAVPGLPA